MTMRSRLLFLGGLLAFQLAWIVALPAFTAMDEFDHAYRAGSVGAGHWQAGEEQASIGRGVLLSVPGDLPEAARDVCLSLRYTGWDNCIARTAPDASGEVTIASAAGNYNPAWYWVAGKIAQPWEGDAALYAMRATTVLLSNLLLLFALTLSRRVLPGWGLVGLAVVLTPTITYATAVAAPNGVGYAGAVLLWTALLRLPLDSEQPVRAPLVGTTVGAVVVMCTHSTGPLWVLAILVCGSPLWWSRARVLLRHHRVPTALVVSSLAVVLVSCVLWIVASGTNDPRQEDADFGRPSPLLLLKLPVFLLLQSVATLQFRNQAAPAVVYVVAILVIALLLTLAWRRSAGRARAAMGLVALASLVAPIAATWIAYPLVGDAWQARYGFPLYVGILLIALEASRGHRPRRAVGVTLLLVASSFQLLTLCWVLAAGFDDRALGTAEVARYAAVTGLCLVGGWTWTRALESTATSADEAPSPVEMADATVRA